MSNCPFLSTYDCEVECFKECPFYCWQENNGECPFKTIGSANYTLDNIENYALLQKEYSFLKENYLYNNKEFDS